VHGRQCKRVQNCILSLLVQLDESCHGQPLMSYGTLSACDRFSLVEKRWWDCARGLAQRARVCQQLMGRRRMVFAYLGYPVIPRLARMLARGVDGTDFRPSRSGGGTVPVAAHSLRACRRAIAQRGRLHAHLGFPVAPRLARMLAPEGDGTDFRPSRSGGGTVPVAAHSLRACRGAMAQRGRLHAYLGYPVITRLARMLVREGDWDRFSTVEKR
jgi:hypothetical protein